MKILSSLVLILVLLVASGFDLTRHSIPTDEIRGGGPTKDGIPSLTDPLFVTVDKAAFMRDSDRVLGVVSGNEAKAYPVKILNWHEAVNDRIGGAAILATW